MIFLGCPNGAAVRYVHTRQKNTAIRCQTVNGACGCVSIVRISQFRGFVNTIFIYFFLFSYHVIKVKRISYRDTKRTNRKNVRPYRPIAALLIIILMKAANGCFFVLHFNDSRSEQSRLRFVVRDCYYGLSGGGGSYIFGDRDLKLFVKSLEGLVKEKQLIFRH